MSDKKPFIGITGPVKGGASAWLFTAFAVWAQGGKPVRIYPGKDLENLTLDGLILGGGADINPERYGELLEEKTDGKMQGNDGRSWLIRCISFLFFPLIFLVRNIFSTKSATTSAERDELEFELLQEACARDIPVLGICRGAQLINVIFGGTLHQDISGFYTEVPKADTVWPRKTVSISEESQFYHIIGASTILVNALHHQAIDQLGEALVITAQEQNGIVQGIEHPDYRYMIGVQWHPEYLPQISIQQRIFQTLVNKALAKQTSTAVDS